MEMAMNGELPALELADQVLVWWRIHGLFFRKGVIMKIEMFDNRMIPGNCRSLEQRAYRGSDIR